jgi:biotin carboxyl carrier protein
MKVRVNDKHDFDLNNKGQIILFQNKEVDFDLKDIRPGTFHLLLNNKSFNVEVIESDLKTKHYKLLVNNKIFTVSLKDKLDDLLHELGMDMTGASKVNDLKAPMPGLVLDILVHEGEKINKGGTLIVLEAMKMENALKAIADATVKKISVKKGTTVEKNQVLIQLE